MEQQNDKQLIFFKDLLFSALYQWKLMVIFGLIFAILLGAYGVISANKTTTVGNLSLSPQIQVKVDYLEKQKATLNKKIEENQIYLDNSILMAMDSYNVYTYGCQIHVQSTYDVQPDAYTVEADISALLGAYRYAILRSDRVSAIAQKYGVEHQYLQELISFELRSGCMIFLVKASTAEQAQQLGEALLEGARNDTAQIAQDTQAHQVDFVTYSSGPVYDTTVQDKQTAVQKLRTTHENELQAVETELKKYAPTELIPSNTNPLVLAIVGGILGVFLVAGIACLIHLGSEKIYSARVLRNRTGIKVLGSIQDSRKRDPITRLLRKLEGRAGHDSFDAVAANIRNLFKGSTLLIMGKFSSQELTALTEALEQAGIQCKLCEDPAVKADALNALPQADAVVLCESCGSSRYDSVEWAMETVADQDTPLLGCVLLGG